VLLALLLFSQARADDADFEEYGNPSGKVEVQYPAEARASYRDRRGDWSPVIGINMSQVLPKRYYSQIDGNSYGDMFGANKSLSLIQAQLGEQYNFRLGSFGASLDLGGGSVNGSGIGESRTLTLLKAGGALTYTMNNIWPEPYVAPYVSGEIYTFKYKEDGATDSKSGSTAAGMSFTVGLLVQLNWLDPESSLDARNSSGLNNIFLDLFAEQYNTSSSSADANFESDLNWGAGLKFEF
jgi:hypothetical protein